MRTRTIEQSVIVERPIRDVWDTWTDVRRLPDLSRSTVAVVDAPERLSAVGESFCQVVRAAGQKVDTTWTVTEIEAQDHLTISGQPMRGVGVELTERVEDLGDDRTRLTMHIDYHLPFGPLGAIAAKLGIERIANDEARSVLEKLRELLLAQPVTEGAPRSPGSD